MVGGCMQDSVSILVIHDGNVHELVGKDVVCVGVMHSCGSCCCSSCSWDQGWDLCGWSQGGSCQYGMPVVDGIVGREAVLAVLWGTGR